MQESKIHFYDEERCCLCDKNNIMAVKTDDKSEVNCKKCLKIMQGSIIKDIARDSFLSNNRECHAEQKIRGFKG
jgi:hypothetical protein